MSLVYVIGGKQRKRTIGVREWSQYERAVAVAIDPTSGAQITKLEYVSPETNRPAIDHSSVLFKSAHFESSRLHLCTQTEILTATIPDLRIESVLSSPLFNDVHHVLPTDRGTRLVAVTGLDLVVEIDQNGGVVNEWNTCDQPTWERFSKSIDYRKILTTKPHLAHPNYLFTVNDEYWVTRFENRDAFCLNSPKKSIKILDERPHDGVVYKESVYFTTVDGRVVVFNLKDFSRIAIYDLSSWIEGEKIPGWCRGLHVINDSFVIVGFSAIRPTKAHENLLWLKNRFSGGSSMQTAPTHIALFNLKKKELCWALELEQFGLDVVFSIYADQNAEMEILNQYM